MNRAGLPAARITLPSGKVIELGPEEPLEEGKVFTPCDVRAPVAAVPEGLGPFVGEPVTATRTPAGLSVEQILAALWLFDPTVFDPGIGLPADLGLSPAAPDAGLFRTFVDTAVINMGLLRIDTEAAVREANPPAPGSYAQAWEARARVAIAAMLAAEAETEAVGGVA